MPIVTPVFNFNGRCEEAIELYKKAFDAKVKVLLRYSDADEKDLDLPFSDTILNKVYHCEMMIGDQRIMFSDNFDIEITRNTSEFLLITYNTPEEVKRAYEILKEGSTIIYPLKSTTYSSCFVSLIDKFGFRWGIMTETA